MKLLMSSLLVGATALLLSTGCSLSQCEATCVDSVDLTIKSQSTRFANGRYTFVTELDGVRTTTECTVEEASGSCKGGDMFARPTADGALSVKIIGRPKRVDMTMTFGATFTAKVAFDPSYNDTGEVCGTSCKAASQSVTVP